MDPTDLFPRLQFGDRVQSLPSGKLGVVTGLGPTDAGADGGPVTVRWDGDPQPATAARIDLALVPPTPPAPQPKTVTFQALH